jgi:hypothetical protein
MRRTIFVALGIGAIVSSAAAIGITAAALPEGPGSAESLTFAQVKLAEASARAAQRSRIEARYRAERNQCEALSGLRHDRCLIAAHAHRGHALLEAAAPYQGRG